MNKIQNAEYKEVQRVNDFGVANQEAIDANPLLKKMFGRSGEIGDELRLLKTKQMESGAEATEEKKEAIEHAIDLGLNNVEKMVAYGRFEKFGPFANLKFLSKRELLRGKDEDTLTYLRLIDTTMDMYPDETTAAEVTAEDKTAAKEAHTAATALVDAPDKFKEQRHQVSLKIDALCKEFRELRDGSMDLLVRSVFETANKKLYQDYMDTKQPVVYASRVRAVAGTLKDTEGKPVRLVRISIDGTKPKIAGGKKGNFFIQNLTPGVHTLTFSRKSYKSVTVDIIVHPDQTVKLDIVFESVEVEKKVDA